MSLFWWRIIGVAMSFIGVAGVGFGINDYVNTGKIGGASERVSKNSGPFILVVFAVYGVTRMWVGKPELNLQFPDDTAFKPGFPAKKGEKVRVSGDLTPNCVTWNTLTLANCELTPDAEDAILAEELTRECMENDQAATEKHLSGRDRYRVVVEGTISFVADKAFLVTLYGHREEKKTKPV